MDMEKYTSGKLYFFFEWAFKLVVWNLLSLFIIFIVSGIPLYIFFNEQEQYKISDVVIKDEVIEITLENSSKEVVSLYNETGEIFDIEIDDNLIYFKMNDNIYKVNNEERIRYITKLEFVDEVLLGYYEDKIYEFGEVLNSDIDTTTLDGGYNLIIKLENGVTINYGKVFNINTTYLSILIFIFIILALFTFIPVYITIFSMIKIFASDGSASTFTLYFDRLLDNFKSIYKLEIILVLVASLFIFSFYYYYTLISYMESINFFISMSYNIILITLISIVLFILNLPLTLGYFRMNTKTIFRFNLIMTFKNILYSLCYLGFILLPILACFINNFFIPIWFLLGLSMPQFLAYFISLKKYKYISKNINIIKESEL